MAARKNRHDKFKGNPHRSAADQIRALDKRLGNGQGAEKERDRLHQRIRDELQLRKQTEELAAAEKQRTESKAEKNRKYQGKKAA